MLDPLDFKNRPLLKNLERKRKLAAISIILERTTLALWRPVSWGLFFCALWMFQIPQIFGESLSLIVTLLFASGFGYLLYSDLRFFKWPSGRDINRRVEKDSHILHRPISGLEDRLANPTKQGTRQLWDQHHSWILKILPKIKISKPRAFMAQKDKYALRLGVLLFFVLGLWVSGPAWNDRIWNGLTPINLDNTQKIQRGASIWITPPEYTGAAQIVLENLDTENQFIQIPAGSRLKVKSYGGLGQPSLHIGEKHWSLSYEGEDSYSLEIEVPAGNRITLKQFFMTKAAWDYELLADNAPTISLKEGEPQIMPDGPLRFATTLYDDYGVQTLTMTMDLDELVEDAPYGEVTSETRSIISPAKTEFEITPVYDLTAHPWAGLPAVITLKATDHIGQHASTDPVKITLPERPFQHPVAKKLIALRKKMIWSPEADYEEIGQELQVLLNDPSDFEHDIVVFLSIRAAASRLFYTTPSNETAKAIIALLWDTALRVEDGNLTLAARNLRDIQMQLEQALQNPETNQDEIAQLMHELRQAMAEYFMELHKEMQKRMAEGQNMQIVPPETLSHIIDPEALANFLDQLEQEMLSGDMKSAQEMLSQLQRMMDFMDPSITMPMPMDMQMMADGVNELQELIDRQEELLEQTQNQVNILQTLKNFKSHYGQTLPQDTDIFEQWGLEAMPPAPQDQNKEDQPVINTQPNKTEQDALRFILGQLMLEADEVLGEIPENMGLAEREMLQSSEHLGQNDPNSSIPNQEKAIEYLKEAQQKLSQQFMARMQQVTGMTLSGGMRYDPLGRPYGEQGPQSDLFPGSRVEIPDEAEKKRAQEILRELRRRSGEFDRPDAELEYFQRLLRQF